MDNPDDPHICGTWGHKTLKTLLSIQSGNQGLHRAMYCLAKWAQPSWQILALRWTWKVTVHLQQEEAPSNCMETTTPCPSSLLLCLFMVAACLMTVLWQKDTATQHYPHFRGEDMPRIQRSFFETVPRLQQTDPDVLQLTWNPPR